MIQRLSVSDIHGLNFLPPPEWKFDYEAHLKTFINENFFHAFVLKQNHKIVGTGNIIIHNKIAWLGNIIVDQNYRAQGLGFQMTKFLVDLAKDQGCETQLLIATKLGESVYKKLGFETISHYVSFDSITPTNYQTHSSIRKLEASDFQEVQQLDTEANAEDRSHLLKKFYNNGWAYFDNHNNMIGFYLPHFGRGLIIAKDNQAGCELLKLKHSHLGKRTLLPIENQQAIDYLTDLKLTKGDECSRMILGKMNSWNPHNIYSYGSGYCG